MTVLVSAASKYGATYEIAERIAAELTQSGVAAVAVPLEDVAGLEGYDAVVLGSGIYAGRWLEPAKRFVDRHLDGLRARPVWLFSSGPIGDPPKPEDDPIDGAPIRERTLAREHRVIAGLVDRTRLNFAERTITRVVGAAEGDFRPWDEIDAWARSIADQLGSPAAR